MENKFLEERKSIIADEQSEVESLKDRKKSFQWSKRRIVALIMAFLFVYLSTVLISNFVTIRRFEKENQLLEEQLAAAEAEIKELSAIIENAEDPAFIEKMAREKLKMVKPDETVYFVVK